MPRTTKTTTTTTGPTYLTRSDAKEMVESIVREASRELARDMEKHLTSIHNRLVEIERSSR
jgi:hypothetical protein